MSKLKAKNNMQKKMVFDSFVGSVALILLIGLLSFIYIGNTLYELQQNRQVLGVTSQDK